MKFMSLDIILYGSSPVVQKIFSHVLYHYIPTVNRIGEITELIKQTENKKPDIIFIDDSFNDSLSNEEGQLQVNHFLNQVEGIPLIWIHEKGNTDNIPGFAKDSLPKPIESEKIRNIVHNHVPKLKTYGLKDHLILPSTPESLLDKQNTPAATVGHLKEKEPSLTSPAPEKDPPFPGASSSEPYVEDKTIPVTYSSPRRSEAASYASAKPSPGISDDEPAIQVLDPEKESRTHVSRGTDFNPQWLKSKSFQDEIKTQINQYFQELKEEKLMKTLEESSQVFFQNQGRQIIQEILEKAIWTILPEITKSIVKQELEKLLVQEEDSSPQPKTES